MIELKKLFTIPQPNIESTIVNDLQPDININANGEKAAYLQKLPNGIMGTSVATPTNTGSIGIRTGTNHYSAIHTHPFSCYPMFSWSDILVLHRMNKDIATHNEGMASFLLVCKDDNGMFQTYAIVFNQETIDVIDAILNSPGFAGMSKADIAREMDTRIKKKFDKEYDNGTRNYERAFLEQFANMNISLFKANTAFTNWSRIRLNTATNNTQGEPCN